MLIRYCFMLSLVILVLTLTACGTWEVKFGVSEYNNSVETRGYDVNRDKR